MKTSVDYRGLSSDEAARRLVSEGANLLPGTRRRMIGILFDAMREPMFMLLLGAAALYLVLGDLHEGLMLLFMVCVTIGLTLYQEGKTERALDALRDLSSPRALVLRDGQTRRIAGSDLVRGDLLLLAEGDRIAADAILVNVNNLQVDESLLTGESLPVTKQMGPATYAPGTPGGDNLPFVWSGTLVVQGEGIAQVTSTGARSELGRIGGALAGMTRDRSVLQVEVGRLVRRLAIAGIALSVLVTVMYFLLRGDWLQSVLVGIALAMSMLPEEYPVILTVFPAIGAWRLSRVSMLTRRLPAIETLGSISVLCTDKTGTLTENRMRVVEIYDGGARLQVDAAGNAPLSPIFKEIALAASLASRQHAFDPMEIALHQFAVQVCDNMMHGDPVREYPLSSNLRAMSVARLATANRYSISTKGAPETIAALCHLSDPEWAHLQGEIDRMAAKGIRVLGIARAEFFGTQLPEAQDTFAFRFLGLIGLADPLRQEIPDAIRQCGEAGIRVVMITGDYPATAATIAQQAGLYEGKVLAGDELDRLDDAALQARLRAVRVCARITPQQKLRIVQALKSAGEIVAMTGDGVNDAPALKAAHVGIAMGGRGTDVAREAAAIVLLDDNFASIVRGIRLGRRIFVNMQNAMSYVMSMHVPIAGMALVPALFGWPILLYPMHIAFLELIIDPACSLAFENEASEDDAMLRPPRNPKAPLFGAPMFIKALLQGGGVLLLLALAYFWAIRRLPEPEARAAGFAVLVAASLALIFSHLSCHRNILHAFRSSNPLPLMMAGAALAVLLAAIYLPVLASVFHFAPLKPTELAMAVALGFASLLWLEATKSS